MKSSHERNQFQALSLETALESFMDGVVIIDSNRNVTYSNGAARKICRKINLPADLDWSRYFGIFFADSKAPCPTENLPIIRALRGEEVREEMLYLKNEKMDQGHFVSCNARPVFNEGKIAGAIMSFRVMTEALEREHKHQEERKLFEAERRKMEASFQMTALGSTLAELGHEIKNPLAVISTAHWLLKRMLNVSPLPMQEIQTQLDQIQVMVEKVDSIVKSVRNASRNNLVDPPAPQSIQEMLKDALNVCVFRLKGIRLEVPEELPTTLNCSRVQFCQVLVNLVSNAADAIEGTENPWIKISVQETEDSFILRIQDSGNGIPESEEEKAFGRFYTTKGFGKGTGLGLPLSRTYVENLSGKLSINRSISASCFEISIPTRREKAQKAA